MKESKEGNSDEKAILYLISFLVRLVEKKSGIEQKSRRSDWTAMQLEKELNAEVTHTIICGDNILVPILSCSCNNSRNA